MKVWIVIAYECGEDYTESEVVGVFSDQARAEAERDRIAMAIEGFQQRVMDRRNWRQPTPQQMLQMLRDGKTRQEIEVVCEIPPNPIPTKFSDFTYVEVEEHEVR